MVVDTETTGTKGNRVCQLAYLDFSSGKPEAGNMYFAVDEMSDYAKAVHGLSISDLLRLSEGKRFGDAAESIRALMCGKRIAGHNVSADISAIRGELERCGMGLKPEKQFCTMHHFAPIMNVRVEGQRRPKDPRLSELCKYLCVTENAVLEASRALYGADTRAHDARFDVCATYLCIEAAEKAGMVRGLLSEGA